MADVIESRRVVAIRLPVPVWDYLEHEAEFRSVSFGDHVSDMIVCALKAQGMKTKTKGGDDAK